MLYKVIENDYFNGKSKIILETDDLEEAEEFVNKKYSSRLTSNMQYIIQCKYYMHVDTGDVDTEENWIKSITEEEIEENFKSGTTAQEAFDSYVRDNIFVEIERDKNDDWIKVK